LLAKKSNLPSSDRKGDISISGVLMPGPRFSGVDHTPSSDLREMKIS
jgi:hypothetical protein